MTARHVAAVAGLTFLSGGAFGSAICVARAVFDHTDPGRVAQLELVVFAAALSLLVEALVVAAVIRRRGA